MVYDELLKAYSRQDRDGLFHQFLRYKYILLDKPCEECLDQALNSFCAGQKISDIILHTVFEDKCCHEPYLLVIWRAWDQYLCKLDEDPVVTLSDLSRDFLL